MNMLNTYSGVTFNEGIRQLNLLCYVHKKNVDRNSFGPQSSTISKVREI